MMKPPEEVFPQRKAAEFDETGRPHHPLFYTSKPNFFRFLHDIVTHQQECDKFEDRMIRQQKTADPALQINLTATTWISKDQLELKLVENIRDIEYGNFVSAMTRLANSPYSYRSKDFIDQYRRALMDQNITIDIPKAQVDQDGRNFITVYGKRVITAVNHHKSQSFHSRMSAKARTRRCHTSFPGQRKNLHQWSAHHVL